MCGYRFGAGDGNRIFVLNQTVKPENLVRHTNYHTSFASLHFLLFFVTKPTRLLKLGVDVMIWPSSG